MLVSFARESVVRIRRAKISDHGETIPDPDLKNASRVTISPVVVNPGATVKDSTNRAGVTINWTVFAPVTADILADDLIEYDGVLYEQAGAPMKQGSPTGRLAHKVLLLTNTVG